MDGNAKGERERIWRGHLAARQKSGLSQAAYCRQHHTKKKNGLRIRYYDCKNASACQVEHIPAEPFEDWATKKTRGTLPKSKTLWKAEWKYT